MRARRCPTIAVFALALAAAPWVAACARNAVLDLDVVIPPQASPPDLRRHAFVEVGTGLNDFADQVLGLEGARDVDVTTLDGSRAPLAFSIVAGDPSTELRVRVRYCRAERCSDPSDMRNFDDGTEPGLGWVFERAFYVGERTSASITVPALAPGIETGVPTTVCRCAVIGCAVVPPGTSSCRMTTMTLPPCDPTARHFCE